MRDLDNERLLIMRCLIDLDCRLHEIESKFNMHYEENDETWRDWDELKNLEEEGRQPHR